MYLYALRTIPDSDEFRRSYKCLRNNRPICVLGILGNVEMIPSEASSMLINAMTNNNKYEFMNVIRWISTSVGYYFPQVTCPLTNEQIIEE